MADVAFTPVAAGPVTPNLGHGGTILQATLTNTNAATEDFILDDTVTDFSFQLKGTFDSATAVLEGSNDGTNFLTLTDLDGGAMSFTADPTAMLVPREPCRYYRVSTSGGGGSQSIVVTVFAIRAA